MLRENKGKWRHGAYITELDQSKFSQRVYTFAANFIGNVKLHHAHVRRTEHGLLGWSHDGGVKNVDVEAPSFFMLFGWLGVVRWLFGLSIN